MAPLVSEFQNHRDDFETRVCVTAQHREMLDQVLKFFNITPDYDLNLMRPGQSLFSITADVITSMNGVFQDFKPDYVFVHGDTTTSMAASLSAFYFGAQICHVEAGLRTFNKKSPYPEEVNRRITGILTDYHFSPTDTSKANLLREGVPAANICVTGNTVIDALNESLEILKHGDNQDVKNIESSLNLSKPFILVTGHRRENFGQGFLNICKALRTIAEVSGVNIIYPVHLNPNVQEPVNAILGPVKNVHLIPPQPYPSFVWLMSKASIIITDSGGVQEEAPSLGKPVLVMRDTTERPEAVEAGTVILVGTDENKIVSEALDLLGNPARYEAMSKLHNPYGDGLATKRIVEFLKNLGT